MSVAAFFCSRSAAPFVWAGRKRKNNRTKQSLCRETDRVRVRVRVRVTGYELGLRVKG